ncbi:hypothetical protein FQA39_LY16941 [Lamprigera yunnana]|nr:hypothetical protein FQA39_LY16941 [Lamprigera yunnana]
MPGEVLNSESQMFVIKLLQYFEQEKENGGPLISVLSVPQVDNNSGQINGICQRLREQGIKLINVETKINQVKPEMIQVCKDLNEQSKEIVDDVQKKTKILNKMIMNYKEGEYRIFQEPQKGFMKNYWGIKKESVMKSELYGTKFNLSLRASREEYVSNNIIVLSNWKKN